MAPSPLPLQEDFMFLVLSMVKWPAWKWKMKTNQNMEALQDFLDNPDLDLNFEIDGQTPLSLAAKNTEILHTVLSHKNVDVNFRLHDGRTCLFAAVQTTQTKSLKLLIHNGAIIDHKDNEGCSPLALAAGLGHYDHVKILVEENADISSTAEQMHALIIKAILGQSDEVLEYVLSKTIGTPTYHDCHSRSPMIAIASGHIGTCQAPLHLAARLGHQKGLEILLKFKFVTNVNLKDGQGRTALAWAVEKSHLMTVETLLNAQGIEIDCHDVQGQTPFLMAAGLGEVEILKKLFDSGANINSEDKQQVTPLAWAVMKEQQRTVEFLLDLPGIGVDQPNNEGRTPFSLAAELGSIRIMQLLLNKQADPHQVDYHGNSAFWWIFKRRDKSETRMINSTVRKQLKRYSLVENLPEPNKKDPSGRNWLSWAASYGDAEIVRALLQNKAVDVNIRDDAQESFSRTPLIWAIERGEATTIKLLKEHDKMSLHLLVQEVKSIWRDKALQLISTLIQAKYNVNQRDFKGRMPLHLACLEADEDVVSDMINAGTEVNCKDHAGKIPLQYALGVRCERAVQSLLNAPSADLKPVTSNEWFHLEPTRASWIQITKRANTLGFDLRLISDTCDWLPEPKESRLCICKKSSIWTQLPKDFGFRGSVKDQKEYFGHFHEELGQSIVTYLCLNFPEGHRGENLYPWGIAWVSKQTTEGFAHGFISTLPNGWMPNNPFELFHQFMDHLYTEWNTLCLKLADRVEELRSDQVNSRGENIDLIDHLAQASKSRAQLSKCLQSHIYGINDVITGNTSFDLKQKPQLRADMEIFGKRLTSKLSHSEQSIRELLQIELAWVSTNESASVKRLSWLTFVFLPPMFVSSLFGMNVNLLENNPDWRWYILCGTLSFVFTGALWLVSKSLPKGLSMNYARGNRLFERSQASVC